MGESKKTLKHKSTYRKPTLPLLMFSEQARMYMGIPMTTSSQAWTAPALHCDMQVFRVSSACWSRSSCSSPSDRLCCVRLSESAMVRLWCGIQEGCRSQKNMTCHTDIKIRLPISIWAHKKPGSGQTDWHKLFSTASSCFIESRITCKKKNPNCFKAVDS